MTQLHAAGQDNDFARTFHRGAQLVTVLGGSIAVVIIFNAEAALRIWLQDHDLARQASPLLTLLLAGNLMNGLCHMPYQAQLAHGITHFALTVNALAAAVLVPLIFVVVPVHGAMGAAAVWAVLNMGYLIVITAFVFKMLLRSERRAWILGDVLKPLLAAAAVAALGNWLLSDELGTWSALASLALLAALACAASLVASGDLARLLWRRVFGNQQLL